MSSARELQPPPTPARDGRRVCLTRFPFNTRVPGRPSCWPGLAPLSRAATGAARSATSRVRESVGLAPGWFLAAANQAGLVALTHTPSPMGFLARILRRPINERPFMLIPIGYPAPDARVLRLVRKSLPEILAWNRDEDEGAGAGPERDERG